MMNKKIFICFFAALLASACSERMICPAYQSSFILDEDYSKNFFSPFEVNAGDTVPKGYQANASDTVFNRTFYAQRGKRQVQQKEGFTYPNRKKKFFLARIWSSPERPVLENPYLLDRILKKRPYWKLDILKPELIHSSSTDTVQLEVPMLIDSLGQAIPDTTRTETNLPTYNVLTVPERYKGYNVDQIEYNRKFGHLFPKPPPAPEPLDSAALLAAEAEALAADTIPPKKKGILGMFKKKNKSPNKKGADDGSGAEEGSETEGEELSKKDKKAARKKEKEQAKNDKAKKKKEKPEKKKKDDKKGKKKEGNDDGVRDEDDAE
ncbi:MAG: hypothetical protein HEP71_14460 [Roseivirga sp.]|nr:hypothetical protein [Roseivirga sp.]